MNDWLPEHHPARFVVEIVEQLDLKPMENAYGTSGSDPFHPALLLSILVYDYATGVFSSSKLENATYDSAAFRFVEANEHPVTTPEYFPQTLPERHQRTILILWSALLNLLLSKRMQQRWHTCLLKTTAGRGIYAQRKCTVEPNTVRFNSL